jgi:hypothetical protein
MATVGSCFTWLRRWPSAKSGGFPVPSNGSDRRSLAYRLRGPDGITFARLFTTEVIPLGPQPIHPYPALFHSGTYSPCSSFLSHQASIESQIGYLNVQFSNLKLEIASPYSHSIVLGGFELISYTTRLMPFTSLTILVDIRSRTSAGSRVQSAVIASSDSTTRTATVNP